MTNVYKPNWKSFRRYIAKSFTVSDTQLDIQGSLGTMRITTHGDGIFRLRLGSMDKPDYGILTNENTCPLATQTGEKTISLATENATLHVDMNDDLTFRLEWRGKTLTESSSDHHFTGARRLPPLGFDSNTRTWALALDIDHEEPLYGGGEKWSQLNHRGRLITSRAEDALGVNSDLSYKNTPFIWSPYGWGVFVHTPSDVHHGCGNPYLSNRAYVSLVKDTAFDVFLFAADGAQGLIDCYHHLTGKPVSVPYWSLGIWMSSAYYKTAEEVLETAQALRKHDMPCDVITLDGRAWQDTETRFAFEWDQSRYPNPKAFTDKIHALDFKLCAWEYPLVSTQNKLFSELSSQGWLLKDEKGDTLVYEWDAEPFGDVLTPLPPSGLLDFTHPEANAYWQQRHQELFESGIDVIKTDFGEQVPDHAVASNGDSGERLHNVYPLLYNRAVYEASQTYANDGSALVFGRSGWAGSHRFPIQWGGDPQADWGGLVASLRGMLSQSLSGSPFYAHDIGGFYGDSRDSELYIRWTQAAVFSSHMRFHGIGAREPWSYGDEVKSLVMPFLHLRYQLLPYIHQMLEISVTKGVPLCRPMVLSAPDEPESWVFDLQYMFGDRLLVAPVVRPGNQARYYLPRGRWVDYWTGEACDGGMLIKTHVSIDHIPLFVKAGETLPMGPIVSHTGETNHAPRIEQERLFSG